MCADDTVLFAMQAGVKRLFLFHHDPDHRDQKIAEMLARFKKALDDLKIEDVRRKPAGFFEGSIGAPSRLGASGRSAHFFGPPDYEVNAGAQRRILPLQIGQRFEQER